MAPTAITSLTANTQVTFTSPANSSFAARYPPSRVKGPSITWDLGSSRP